jgi:hypothetical protein
MNPDETNVPAQEGNEEVLSPEEMARRQQEAGQAPAEGAEAPTTE